MRTKVLALTAAMSAIGAAAMAGEVYSVNAVGFINLPLVSGYTLIANQLNGPAGNNALSAILPGAPAETTVLKYDSLHQTWMDTDYFDGAQWWSLRESGWVLSTTTLSPGEGAFINVPEATQITLVGEVPQGDALEVPIPPNYSLISSIVPQQLFLVASNSFVAVEEMTYLDYNPAAQQYNATLYYDGTQWWNLGLNPGDPWVQVPPPQPAVGQGFFINNPGDAMSWTRTFWVSQP